MTEIKTEEMRKIYQVIPYACKPNANSIKHSDPPLNCSEFVSGSSSGANISMGSKSFKEVRFKIKSESKFECSTPVLAPEKFCVTAQKSDMTTGFKMTKTKLLP